MNTLRSFRRSLSLLMVSLMLSWQVATPLHAATFYWDTDTSTAGNSIDGTGLGGTSTWDTGTSNWWDTGSLVSWPNTSADIAIFTGPSVSGAPTLNTVTLSGTITANQLSFLRSGYTLTGGTSLTLAGAGAGLHANLGESATISSLIAGTDGLTKVGGGSVRLTNASNSYTGTVNIAGGSLIIDSAAALGGTGAVNITSGNSTPSNTAAIGFTGGSLVLDGSAGGFTFSRDLNIEGRGPIGERGAAVLSIGDNTLSGAITGASSTQTPATFRNSRISGVNGTLSLAGAVTSQGTAASTFLTLGAINAVGVGNFTFGGMGTLTGSGSVEKSGGGTLFLNSLASNAGFTGTLRISGPNTEGSQSSVRVTDLLVGGNNVFGGNTGTNNASTIDMNGGVLEFRNDGSLSIGKNVYWRASSTYYTGPAVGGSGVNGTTTFGNLRVASNTTGTFNSRNGFGMTFGTWTQENSNNNVTLNNNTGGTVTFTGNVWNNNDGSNRTLTFGGNGNTTILGSINTSGAGTKTLTKTGSGLLTIQGTGTTLNGPVNVQGSLAITDFRSITNNTSTITLGNATTTAGNLIIGTSGTPSAAGLITSKPITLAGTTASQSIYANQTGTNPVVLNGAITRNGTITTGLVILGGTNTADNTVNVAIPEQGTGGVRKVGAGTWVLAATNGYNDVTTIANGTLKLKADAAVSSILGATNDITFAQTNSFAGGTLELVGQDGINNVQTLDVLASDDGANTIKLTPGAGGTASFVFTSRTVSDDASLNIVGSDATNTVTIGGLTAGALIDRVYFGGNEFATSTAGVLRAPIYGTDAGFVTSATALTATDTNEITGSFSTAGAITIDALKINGGHTLTLTGALSVRTGTTNTDGSILATGGASTITGSTLSTNTVTATGSMSFRVDTGSTLTVESVMNIFSGGLTKSGEGTLILAANNTNTGTVSINEGTIQLSGAGSDLGGGATLTIRDGGVLDLNGVTPTSNTNTFSNAGQVINSGALATFTVGGSNGTGTSFGTVNGAINLTKIGTGAQSWLGTSTYTGVTTIGATGIVTVDTLADGGTASGIGSSTSAASNLVFNGSTGGLRYDGNIRNGDLTLGSRSASTDRLFTLAGTGATIQSQVSNNNALVWSNTGAIVHGVTGPQALIFRGTSTGDNTFNPQLTDSGVGTDITSVSKLDAGQWNLGNAANTYTGITTIGNGILGLNDNGALPANSPVVLGTTTTNGILQMSGTFARNLAATPTAGTGTITWGGTTGGGGFAAHTTSLTVTLDGGAGLTWGSGGFVGTGGTQSLVLSSASALADVNFTNAIDLGAATRTVIANDNGNTGADFAQLSGNLSGAGASLRKDGAGILKLTGANTYTGITEARNGTLVISSLGSSTGGGSSSVGAGGVTMDNTNAIQLGAGGNNAAALSYVGVGETSDRKIRFNSTTGTSSTNQIHADGSGALILTNVVNDLGSGAKTVVLRGTNTEGNMITSNLNDNGGALTVQVDGSATWILTGTNGFTGNLNATAGALGIGDAAAVGSNATGSLVNSNGNIFAFGADRTITRALTLSNNATNGWLGDHSLTFTGANNFAAGANNITTNNSIVAGKTLTFAGLTANALTGNRAWTIDGPGETAITGDFTTSTAFGVNITKSGNGTLTLGTNGATSNWNQAGADLDLDRGTLKFTANNAISTFGAAAPTTTAAVAASMTIPVSSTAGLTVGQQFSVGGTVVGRIQSIDNGTQFTANVVQTIADAATLTFTASRGLTITPELATGDTATVDLNGTTQTVNALTMNTDGTAIIDNTSAMAATLRVGANDAAVSIGGGIGTYTVTDSGAGALSLVKLGSATATIPTGVTLTYQGSTGVEGGTLTIASAVNGTNGLSVTNSGSVLALTGGLTSPSAITSVVVDGGATLSLLDGAGSLINSLTTLSLGAGAGTATLNLNVGDGATDTLTLLTGSSATLANTITFNLTDAGLSPSTTYTLLNLVDGGITAFGIGNMILGATPGGFLGSTFFVDNNFVQFTTGTLITGDLFWRGLAGGGTDDTWNANVNNWSLDKANTSLATSIPGQGTDVIFAIDSATGAVATTLEQNFKINSLTFEAGTTTPTSVTIAPGAVSTNRLEVAPQVATDGIAITAGGPAVVTISAPLKIGANQTWTVADSASVLTLSGGLQGEADVTKAGDGKVILGAPSDPTFNSGVTSDFTINAGTLELTDVGALGNPTNANFATVTVNSGAAFYYNGAASTATNLAMPLTLNGGTLSAGGANQNYSGTVNVNSASTINLRNSNGGIGELQERNITLSGVVSGSGDLTIDSDVTPNGGNAFNGTLTLNNASNTWNGDVFINQGTLLLTSATSPLFTTNDLTFNSFGRLQLQGVSGQTLDRSGTLNFAAGALAELSVDTTGTVTTDFTVNQNGAVTLGSGGTGATVRVFAADTQARLNIVGGVTLGGNSSISVAANAARLLTIDGVIDDGASSYSLAINDDAGSWGQTNGIVHLTNANTYDGGTTLASGILRLGNKDALGTGTMTVTGSSTIQASTNLTGASKVTNAFSIGAFTLTFSGTESLEIGGAGTFTGAPTLSASGTGGATVTYSGAISAGGNNFTLTGLAGSAGIITGGITQTGDAADATVSGGTWTHQTGTSRVGDELTITGANTILNLNSGLLQVRDEVYVVSGGNLNLNGTGVLSFNTPTVTSGTLRAYTGGIITLGANEAVVSTEFDELRIGVDGTGLGTLNMGTFTQTTTALILGNRNLDREGIINGTGTLTVTGNLDLYEGTINANLASTGTTVLEKIGPETVTLKGNNTGLTSTGNSIIYAGTLVLDYSVENNDKLRAASVLNMRGGVLEVLGNNSAATSQTVNGLSLANLGYSQIQVTGGTGQEAVLNLGGITRAASAGMVRFILPSGTQSATNGITTTAAVTNGLLGTGAAFATVNDGTGTWFATKSGNNIVALASTAANDVTTWAAGADITDETTGFTGLVQGRQINTLRFDAAGGSAVNIDSGDSIHLASGGILVTNNVAAGSPGILGGRLRSGVGELLITNDSTQDFTISSQISSGARITKAGTGTLVLSNPSNVAGELQINEGTVVIAGGNTLSDTARVFLAENRQSSLVLQSSETIGALQGGRFNAGEVLGVVDLGAHTLTINQSDNDTTANENFIYDGTFVGSGTLIKNGIDYLTLRGNSTLFTGLVQVNNGRLDLQNTDGRLSSASGFVINAGAEIIARQDQTSNVNRLTDSAPITLNNTAGTASITGLNGLWIYNQNQSATRTENSGEIILGAGHNIIRLDPNQNNASTVADLLADTLSRQNRSTAVVNGLNLGAASGRRGRIRFDAAGQTAMDGFEVGNGSGSGTQFGIIPFLIGQTTTGGVGNSFVTHVDGTIGLRPLATGEYVTDAVGFNGLAGVSTDNVRFAADPGAALTGTASAINSLVIDSGTAVTLTGPASALEITTGAFLAAGNGNHVLDGFTALTTGGGRDYTVFTTGTGTVTLGSALTSAVPLVKSGQGTLALTSTSNAFTDVYLNQGHLLVNDLDKLGTGGLNFFGGGLRLDTGFADDLGGKTFAIGTGGGAIDTNGIDVIATDLVITGDGTLTKAGLGSLTFAGNTATGLTGQVMVTRGSVVLNQTAGVNAIGAGGIFLDSAAATGGVLLTNAVNEQIADTARVSMINDGTNAFANWNLAGFTETVGSLELTGVSNSSTGTKVLLNGGTLILNGDIVFNNNRGATGNDATYLEISGDGTAGSAGTLDLGGANRTITVETNQTGTNANGSDAGIEVAITNGGIIKEGSRTLFLSGTNTYAGPTTINEGTVSISSASNLGDGSVTNSITIRDGATLRSTGASVTLTQALELDGHGGNLEVAGASTNILIHSGVVSGHNFAPLTKTGVGILSLTAANTYTGGTTVSAGTLEVNNTSGSGTGTGSVILGNAGSTLAGSGSIAGSTILGAGTILAPGEATPATSNKVLTFTAASTTAVTVNDGAQIQLGISNEVFNSVGFVAAFDAGSAANALAYLTGGGAGELSSWNAVPGAGDSDFLNLTGAGSNLSLGTGAGTITILDNGYLSSTPVKGDVFNLIDWTQAGVIGGSFNAGTGFVGGGALGDFELPTLGAGLAWDTSAFTTYGVIVIVPEPSRVALLLLGLLGLISRRRRLCC